MTPEERAEARRLLDDHELSLSDVVPHPEHYLRLALDALEQAERDREQMRAMLDKEAALLRTCIQTRGELGEKWLAERERAEQAERERAKLREMVELLAAHCFDGGLIEDAERLLLEVER